MASILTYWQTAAKEEKDKGLVLRLSNLSWEPHEFYTAHQDHYQAITKTYLEWYGLWHKIVSNNNSSYYFVNS